MAHQSGYNATASFSPPLYWTNTLMTVTHWDLFYEARQYEVPYMGTVRRLGPSAAPVVPDYAEGKARWRATLAFLPPQELSANQMDVGLAADPDDDLTVTLFMNGADYWAGLVRIASYRVVAPADGPITAIARLRGRGTLTQTVA